MLAASSTPAAAQDTPPPPSPPPTSSTGLSGYMDFHYNKVSHQDGELDFHRFVLLVTHRFSDRIRFVSELELEHAFVEGLEDAGEIELEQAYVDFLLSRSFNVRAGMVLMPIGIINERHEPPVYYGVERPLVDTVVVPTTWFEVGAGIHGEVGRGWRYRAYLTSPLNAAEFSAEEGVRDGRQRGNRTNIGRAAVTGRVEFVGVRGLTTGASAWAGSTGFEFRPRFDVPVRLFEADVRYARDRFEGRAQLATVDIQGAADLNDAIFRTTGVNPNVARTLRGGYLEASYRVISGAAFGDVGDVRALRERRHAVPHARRLRAAEAVRSRPVGRRRHLLARARHRDQGRLRPPTEPERHHQRAQFLQRRSRMVVLMTRIAFVVCALALVSASAWSWTGQPPPAATQTVDIAAERFSFTPSEVKATVGTTLTIRLTSDDTAHGFRILGTDVNVEIPKRSRGVTTVSFTPEKAGRYTFECSKLCGAGHSFMRGVIVVDDTAAGAR